MSQHPTTTGRRRALMTDRERELIRGEDPDVDRRRVYQAVSQVRNKIQDELPEDIAIMKEHNEGLYEDLLAVMATADGDGGGVGATETVPDTDE